MNKILLILKRIVLAFTLIYSFNIIVASFNLNIAVNPYSVGIVSTLGVPGMISLVIVKLLLK